MPSYVFEFTKAGSVERTDPIELVDDHAVRLEAVRGAKDLMCEGIVEGLDRTGWVVRAFDGDDRLVLRLNFADLLEKD